MRSTAFRAVAAAAAVAGLAAAALTSNALFLALAFVALLFLATSLSEAGRLTGPLQSFVRRDVEIRVWGSPLPVPGAATLTVTSVRAVGAGLHLFLRVGPGGPSGHLKVAQPRKAQIQPVGIAIESAAYVQWADRKLPRVAGAPALTISVDPRGHGGLEP